MNLIKSLFLMFVITVTAMASTITQRWQINDTTPFNIMMMAISPTPGPPFFISPGLSNFDNSSWTSSDSEYCDAYCTGTVSGLHGYMWENAGGDLTNLLSFNTNIIANDYTPVIVISMWVGTCCDGPGGTFDQNGYAVGFWNGNQWNGEIGGSDYTNNIISLIPIPNQSAPEPSTALLAISALSTFVYITHSRRIMGYEQMARKKTGKKETRAMRGLRKAIQAAVCHV
jgi:hypothetical protein